MGLNKGVGYNVLYWEYKRVISPILLVSFSIIIMINNIVLDSNAFFKSNTLVELIKDSNPYTTSSVID